MKSYLVSSDIQNLKRLISKIGPDEYAKKHLLAKMVYIHIYIEDLTPTQANIIKQTMLSIGSDAVVNKGCINHTTEKSDCLIFGSIDQLKRFCQKLKMQPFKLSELSFEILNIVEVFENDCLYTNGGE